MDEGMMVDQRMNVNLNEGEVYGERMDEIMF
jgi:hypothetical protein